jgi:chemotaxis protein methyltransferase CheR
MEISIPGLTKKHSEKISRLVYKQCGIDLRSGKEALMTARLSKRLRALGLADFDDYVEYLESDPDGEELGAMVESLTTNKTSFFRESAHFDYLRQHVLPTLAGVGRGARIWCAGCSSGEEPYTLGVTLRESMSAADSERARVLATDISTGVLDRARRGIYASQDLRELPRSIVEKYFTRIAEGRNADLRVKDSVRSIIRFARLNLMDKWPMKGPFDAIFCRNVMIYFDKPTRQDLVRRFWGLLSDGGYLFVGHSESLAGMSHDFMYMQPAVYVRKA